MSTVFQTPASEIVCYDTEQAWYGPDVERSHDWVHVLTPEQIAELDAAVLAPEKQGRDILTLGKEEFHLPSLTPVLQEMAQSVLHGRGFYLIRGLPVERYTKKQSALAFWALGVHTGDPVSQNGKGHVLGHVTNLGLNYSDPEVRGYQTSARLPYHTDSSDMVGLLCLRKARSGGLSSIVSSTTIWNELVQSRPDLAQVLLDGFHRTRWGEIPAGQKPYASSPIFAALNGRMFSSYVRSAIHKAQAMEVVPRLTPLQIEAMDHLDAFAADPRIHLDMDLAPGDMQFVSNYSVYHSRTSYEDDPDPERRRHMLRLWLACDDGPEIPESLLGRNGVTEKGRPNGILVPGVPLVAPLEAA